MLDQLIRPGLFAEPIAADMERMNFDYHNEAVLFLKAKPDFVFIGDSITQYWDLPLFFGRDKLLINRGIGGDIPKFILKRFDADVLQLKPEYCVFMAGTNCAHDLENNIWVGMKAKPFETVVEGTIASIIAVINYALEHQQKIIVGAIPPAIIPSGDRRNEMILLVNAAIKQYCERNEIIYVDYHSALLDKKTEMMRQDCTTDGIHPDSRGFLIMTKTLKDTLAQHNIEI